MEATPHAVLWQAVHAAYEARDPDEARRLLHAGTPVPDCSILLRCGDEDYIRWLLSHELISLSPADTEAWPTLQERQLQCNALTESARPACILDEPEWQQTHGDQ